MELIKPTSLETTTNVKETLNWKIAQLEQDGKNISNGLADYLYLGVNNIEMQLDQLKQLESEIKERKNALNEQIKAIKQDGAAFLLDNGINKLDGVLASSVTVTEESPPHSRTCLNCLYQQKKEINTWLMQDLRFTRL